MSTILGIALTLVRVAAFVGFVLAAGWVTL